MHKCVPTARNIHILFHEPVVCRSGAKMKKGLLDEEK